MKSKKKIVIAGLICAGIILSPKLSAQEPADTLNLTLDDALKIALSENLTVQVADKEVTKQEYSKKGTYASLFPQVDLKGSYQRTIAKQTMYLDGMDGMEGMGGGAVGEGIKVGRDNSWSAGVSASMPIISAPTWKSLSISSYGVELAIEKARSSRIELVDQVKQAYYTVLLAYDSYEVYQNAYENAVENHKDIKQKFDEGLASEYDVIRANVNVKNAEPNVFDAENSIILAHWQLKALLGLDLENEIKCTGTLADYEQQLEDDIFQQQPVSLDNNSDLKQLEIQFMQLEKTKEMQMAQNYPSLSANFAYDMTSTNNDFKFGNYRWDPYSYAGLSLTIPIFAGGKRNSEIKKAKIDMEMLEKEKTNIERNLRVAAKQSADQMATCIKQYYSAMEGVKESEKSYQITMVRYDSGEGTLLDINDAQLSMTQAKLNLNQAIYNYLVARSSLEKTLGESISQYMSN